MIFSFKTAESQQENCQLVQYGTPGALLLPTFCKENPQKAGQIYILMQAWWKEPAPYFDLNGATRLETWPLH